MPTLLSLADQHRRAQAQLLEALELALSTSWRRAISPVETRALSDAWIASALPLIAAYRARSAALARISYQAQRLLAFPDEPFDVDVEPDDLVEEALIVALRATGITTYLDDVNNPAKTLEDALDRSAAAVAGAGVKHVLDGGRSYTTNAIERDRLALGWYRVTKDGCCSFCAVLASRGMVYKQDSFDQSDPRFEGEGTEKVHDHCACTLAPSYGPDQRPPDRSGAFAQLWQASTRADEQDVAKGRASRVGERFSGNAALNSFRRRYEALYPDAR